MPPPAPRRPNTPHNRATIADDKRRSREGKAAPEREGVLPEGKAITEHKAIVSNEAVMDGHRRKMTTEAAKPVVHGFRGVGSKCRSAQSGKRGKREHAFA